MLESLRNGCGSCGRSAMMKVWSRKLAPTMSCWSPNPAPRPQRRKYLLLSLPYLARVLPEALHGFYLCFVMNMHEYDSSRRKPAIYISSQEPCHPLRRRRIWSPRSMQLQALGNSPETGEKLPAPSKRELLKALTEQQHQLSLLLMAKKKRADEGKAESGILHAARTVRVVT